MQSTILGISSGTATDSLIVVLNYYYYLTMKYFTTRNQPATSFKKTNLSHRMQMHYYSSSTIYRPIFPLNWKKGQYPPN
jgi:hypothetical protein